MSTFYTLTYSDGFQGWPSFYSFEPDWMIGMNNYFYTFKSGDIYRHNVNQIRNNFYNTQYTSTITSVFNDQPLENKLFKTINLESSFADGTHAWGGTFDTDIQTTGFINSGYFELKEGAWFSFMRNKPSKTALVTGTNTGVGANQLINTAVDFVALGVSIGDLVTNTTSGNSALVLSVATTILTLDSNIFTATPQGYSISDASVPTELDLRSVNGIGQCSSVTTVGADIRINFSNTTSIGSSVSIGDTLYATIALTLIGTITAVVVDIPNGNNYIQVNTPAATPNPNDLILFIKNQVAESYGVLGHYCEFVLTNTSTSAVELFAVESEVMKSFP